MASGISWQADVARGTTTLMRRGTEATWQGNGWHVRGASGAEGADTWKEATQSTWVHVGACVGPRGRRGQQMEGPLYSGPWLGI